MREIYKVKLRREEELKARRKSRLFAFELESERSKSVLSKGAVQYMQNLKESKDIDPKEA